MTSLDYKRHRWEHKEKLVAQRRCQTLEAQNAELTRALGTTPGTNTGWLETPVQPRHIPVTSDHSRCEDAHSSRVLHMCRGRSRAGCGLTSSQVVQLQATPPRHKYTTITSARPLDRETRIPDWKGRKPKKNYLSTQPGTKVMVATTLLVLPSHLEFG